MAVKKVAKLLAILLASLAVIGAIFINGDVAQQAHAQQPTGSVPTVTGTPSGPIITVANPEQINVRSGPGSAFYPVIGVLLPGQQAAALGRSPGGDWIMISYPGVPGGVGWIYAPLVTLSPGFLQIIEPPPTPTPLTTATIDPTLAAAFIVSTTPTRLPTFTAPAPLVLPTFTAPEANLTGRVPSGLVIFGLLFLGIFGFFISFLRSR